VWVDAPNVNKATRYEAMASHSKAKVKASHSEAKAMASHSEAKALSGKPWAAQPWARLRA